MMGSNKFVFGIISSLNDSNTISKHMQYKTLYDTLMDLDYKIKISFKGATEYSYFKNVLYNFSIIDTYTKEEIYAYYFIENALFRTSSLWEILAQLFRLFYNIKIEINKVYYKKIFNIPDINNAFKDKAKEIYAYFNQEDNAKFDTEWKSSHRIVCELRNKMIHRSSPNIATMSDYDINLKHHPTY